MLDFGEDMKTFQLIVGCILALGFLIIAIYGLRKKWKGWFITCCLLASICMFLISLDWVQGFVQTQAFTSLLRASKQYGEKLNEFQKTTGEMKVQLRQHQDEIDAQQKRLQLQQDHVSKAQGKIKTQQISLDAQHQKIIIQQKSLDSQERELTETQNRLAQTQESIQQQQEHIEDVEFLVRNLFDKTKIEILQASDTNRVAYVSHGDKDIRILFLLEEVPIRNSVHGYFNNSPMKPPIPISRNVAFPIFEAKWDRCKNMEFRFSYVPDPKARGKVSKMEVKDDRLFLDDKPFNVDIEKFNNCIDPYK